jgi:hypothetical protein
MSWRAFALLLLLPACQAAPAWSSDELPTLARARAAHRDLVVYFALPGRDLSEKMEQQTLRAPEVLAALQDGGFDSLRVDAFVRQKLYQQWIGGGEGMGIAVLDGNGLVYAARPGPQDPPELAAYLRLCAERRAAVQQARAVVASTPADPQASYRLGVLFVELGCRVGTEELLVTAAEGGVRDACHWLARLLALDGNVQRARQWQQLAPPSPQKQVTEGYLLFKERKHQESVQVLAAAVQKRDLGADRQRALLFLGKSLHEAGRDPEAKQVLANLAGEGTGSTFEGAALHALAHIQNPDHGHTH